MAEGGGGRGREGGETATRSGKQGTEKEERQPVAEIFGQESIGFPLGQCDLHSAFGKWGSSESQVQFHSPPFKSSPLPCPQDRKIKTQLYFRDCKPNHVHSASPSSLLPSLPPVLIRKGCNFFSPPLMHFVAIMGLNISDVYI
ncbi:hypothetical protein E2320_006291, partial [Naja naja]